MIKLNLGLIASFLLFVVSLTIGFIGGEMNKKRISALGAGLMLISLVAIAVFIFS